jgi:hypothetical protein
VLCFIFLCVLYRSILCYCMFRELVEGGCVSLYLLSRVARCCFVVIGCFSLFPACWMDMRPSFGGTINFSRGCSADKFMSPIF